MDKTDAPVEVPFEENLDLDSFLDSLPGHLRMKVVRQIAGEPVETPQGQEVASPERGIGAPWTAEKVLVAVLVAPVLLALWLTVLAGQLAKTLMEKLIQYTKEKLNEGI